MSDIQLCKYACLVMCLVANFSFNEAQYRRKTLEENQTLIHISTFCRLPCLSVLQIYDIITHIVKTMQHNHHTKVRQAAHRKYIY